MVQSAPVFFLGYLRSELLRRKSRTILTVLGLAVGVSLVIAVSALSQGARRRAGEGARPALEHRHRPHRDARAARRRTRTAAAAFGGGGGGFGGGGREVVQANQSVITDLSKLGKPGDHFVHDFFLPGTQLTFPQTHRDADREGRRRRLGRERARPRRRAPGGDGAEDRGQDQDGRRPDPGQPAADAADGGRVPEDADLPPEAGHHDRRRPGRPGRERPGRNGQNGLGGGQQPRRAASAAAATATRSRSACLRGCGASARRSRRRSRRCSR